MSDTIPPMYFQWQGDGFTPCRGFQKRCDEHLVVGERYRLEVREERSVNSHRHFFASVTEAWRNLPEHLAEQIDSPEKLRKWALIKCGYYDKRQIVCESASQAEKFAAFVRPMDEYAVVTVRDTVVTVYTAQSQSMRAMNKERFQQSKTAVLDLLSGMIGVTREQLQNEGGGNGAGPGSQAGQTQPAVLVPGETAGGTDAAEASSPSAVDTALREA